MSKDNNSIDYYEPITNENSSKMILKVCAVNSKKDSRWQFDNGDGENKFFANIKDEFFLESVLAGEIEFFCGMIISAEVEIQQRIFKNEIKTQYSIRKVYKILNPKQII